MVPPLAIRGLIRRCREHGRHHAATNFVFASGVGSVLHRGRQQHRLDRAGRPAHPGRRLIA